MEPDPRAGRQPERSVKERTVKRHDFKDGEVIFRTSDPSDAAYLITHGQVEIVQERRDGETESVAVLRRGEYFGEMGAIGDPRV
jgi:CRP-like cAMP-binding protein